MNFTCMICGRTDDVTGPRVEEKFYAKAVELGWTVGLPGDKAWCPDCSKVTLFRRGESHGQTGPHRPNRRA